MYKKCDFYSSDFVKFMTEVDQPDYFMKHYPKRKPQGDT